MFILTSGRVSHFMFVFVICILDDELTGPLLTTIGSSLNNRCDAMNSGNCRRPTMELTPNRTPYNLPKYWPGKLKKESNTKVFIEKY